MTDLPSSTRVDTSRLAPLTARFARNAERAGFTVVLDEVPRIEGAGLSEAVCAIAETGSVVLAASPAEPRARSLLPETHISVVREDHIVSSLSELFRALGDRLPSALAIVTGPSRSADIEQILTIGVHGPGLVYVALMTHATPSH